MKITILNGTPQGAQYQMNSYLERLEAALVAAGHSVTPLHLHKMDIRTCIGCFGCWVKTPGQCFSPDDSHQICRAVVQSDFTLWAAPLHMGFPSATLKIAMDKSIPLIHPYFAVVNNEAHHRSRYAHYPRLGLLLEKEANTSQAELEIVTDTFARTALNMKSGLEFSFDVSQPVENILHAICAPKQPPLPYQKKLGAIPGQRITPPQQITFFNGSPRGKKGNTPMLFQRFLDGFQTLPGRSSQIYHLNHLKQSSEFPSAFAEAECVFLGFPLYTDSMPGLVKAFIEQLEPFCERTNNPPIGFLVQSGFPEAAHSRHVERYLEKLAIRLGSPYLGTIVKGGAEGMQIMPPSMTNKTFTALTRLGAAFAERGQLDLALLKTLASPERYPAILAPLFKLFIRLPIAGFYWDMQLKKNGAYERRFAQPYADEG